MIPIQDLIPEGRANRPGLKLRGPEFITIHSTANTGQGANAEMHGRYLRGAAANVPASWHFTVDDREVRQHLPLDEVGWHAGDGREGPGNRTSIGVEICENRDGQLADAVKNAARLTAWLLSRFNLDADRIRQHYHWSGKNCPRIFRDRIWGTWDEFLQLVKEPTRERTPILGAPRVSVAQAHRFFAEKTVEGRTPSRSVKLSPAQVRKLIGLYWEYGGKTGIRPEVAFAQSMKETGYLSFQRPDGSPGAVSPAHNNFAGIKTRSAAGDRPEDHESFPSMEEGVRAHFNHLAAYTGVEPVGEPHGRYHLVMGLDWAGTIRHVEELGGRWAPDPDYGRSIVRDYLEGLCSTPGEGVEPIEGGEEGGPFPDIPAGHWAADHIAWARDKGLVKGMPDGRFAFNEEHLEQKAELVVMFKRFYDLLREESR